MEAIVEAGTRILVRQGREAVTTNSVAAVAGVSIGSLYQYFPNRDAIIAAVAERHARRVRDCIARVDIAHAPTLHFAIVDIIEALFESHFLEPRLHIALVHDLEPRAGSGAEVVAAAGAKPAVANLLMQLPQHFEDGLFVGDLASAAFVIAEMTHALAHAAIGPSAGLYPVTSLKTEAVRATLTYLRHRAD